MPVKIIQWDIEELLNNFYLKNGEVYRKTKNGIKKQKAFKTKQGYHYIRYKRRNIAEHRLIWMLYYKKNPNIIDHIDGNRINNKIENLRNTTTKQNNQNHETHRKGKLLGCSKTPQKRYSAYVIIEGKHYKYTHLAKMGAKQFKQALCDLKVLPKLPKTYVTYQNMKELEIETQHPTLQEFIKGVEDYIKYDIQSKKQNNT